MGTKHCRCESNLLDFNTSAGHASDAEVVREEQSMESEQSTPLDVAEAAAAPKPVPQSVLDMDQPCPVTDFSQGYELPVQKSVEPPQPWLSQPIALPRAVLDANEAWITPAPQPRSRTKEVSHHHEEATSGELTTHSWCSSDTHDSHDNYNPNLRFMVGWTQTCASWLAETQQSFKDVWKVASSHRVSIFAM